MFERGRQVGSFIIDQRIARGGTGEIYLAFQASMKRQVALKIVPVDERMPDRRDTYQRFTREAEVVAKLEHPHIVPLHDYGVWQDEFAFLAMRYMRGGSLEDLIKLEGRLPLDKAIKLFGQVALALDYAHQQHIVHRDIKPSNILLDEFGNAYLTDFGLAKLMEMSLGWTEAGTLVGTPIYASPEQIRDSDTLDYRTDLYSFGVVVYHALAGRPPFEMDERGLMALIRRQVSDVPPSASTFNPNLSSEIDRILTKMIEKEPEKRYASAGDMVRALAQAANVPLPDTFLSQPLLPEPQQQTKWFTPSQIIVFMFVMLFIAIGTVGILSFTQVRSAPQSTQYSLIPNIIGSIRDTEPSASEASLARERVGVNGFIGYIACTMETELTTFLARAMGDVAQEYGLQYEVINSNMDSYLQSTQIETARLQGAKALIVCQLDSQLLAPTLQSAADDGVILGFNSPPLIDDGVVVGLDNTELGRRLGQQAGEYIRDVLGGQARVMVLNLPGSVSSMLRAEAMEAAMLAVSPEAEIVGRYRGVTRENGRDAALSLLNADNPFDVVLSVNDAAALGVISVLEERDYPPDSVAIFSVNGEALARQYVRRGEYMQATIAFDREQWARSTMQAVIKMLGGGTLPRTILVTSGELITRETQAP